MDRQTLRDWVHRFNEEGAEGLRNRKGAGRPRMLSDEQMAELGEIVTTGSYPATDGVVRWRRVDLQKVIEKRFGVTYSERAISDLLKVLGFSHIRQNWLSNRVFDSYDAILDAGCNAWNKLISQPQTITSIGMRNWVHDGH